MKWLKSYCEHNVIGFGWFDHFHFKLYYQMWGKPTNFKADRFAWWSLQTFEASFQTNCIFSIPQVAVSINGCRNVAMYYLIETSFILLADYYDHWSWGGDTVLPCDGHCRVINALYGYSHIYRCIGRCIKSRLIDQYIKYQIIKFTQERNEYMKALCRLSTGYIPVIIF